MGLNGAATAALMARGGMFIGAVLLMYYRLDMLSFNRPNPAELRKSWADILHVGLPAAGTNVIIPIATGVVTACQPHRVANARRVLCDVSNYRAFCRAEYVGRKSG
jgi:Na+-driven multidrug efflux pump